MNIDRREFLHVMAVAVATGVWPGLTPAARAQSSTGWRNWSGNQTCQPETRWVPRSEDELAAGMRAARAPLRPAGAGHSFAALVPTDGTLLVTDYLDGVFDTDPETLEASVGGGTRIGALGPLLAERGQALTNQPDIDYQAIAGAIATSTHGTGRDFGSLSTQVSGLRLATPDGELRELDPVANPEVFKAAAVSLGALGLTTRVRLRNEAPYRLREHTFLRPLEDVLDGLGELDAGHRQVEFYAFPHATQAMVITVDPAEPGEADQFPPDDPEAMKLLVDAWELADWLPVWREEAYDAAVGLVEIDTLRVGPSNLVYAHARTVPFNEMEYSVPIEAGPACLREVLATISEREIDVVFPIEYRHVAADDLWLSMFQGRPTATISIHQFHDRDPWPYMREIEPIFWKYDGRPHWGKLHSLDARRLAPLYSHWQDFAEVREALDPEGRMLNAHLRQVLGVPEKA